MSGLKFNEDNFFWRNQHLISGVIFIWPADFISRSRRTCVELPVQICNLRRSPFIEFDLVAKTLEFNASFYSEPHLLPHLMVKCSARCVVSLNLTDFTSAEGIGLVVAIAAVTEQNQPKWVSRLQRDRCPLLVSPFRTLPVGSVSRCIHKIKPSDLFRISRSPCCLYCCLALA